MNALPSAPSSLPIGPGRLVLVVGPSGAGKDTVIAGVKNACRDNPVVVFPRRVVTRASSDAEEHDTLTPVDFDRAVLEGAFSFWWEAHGLKYGVPRRLDDDIAAGRTAVCNVSRAVVTDVRERYSYVSVVLVTAPHDILAARVAGRSRTSDGALTLRLARNDAYAGFAADYTIENVGAAEAAIDALLGVVLG